MGAKLFEFVECARVVERVGPASSAESIASVEAAEFVEFVAHPSGG